MHPIQDMGGPPLLLRPSPSASTYIIPYSKYQKTLIRQDIQRNKQSALLAEIDRLSVVIRQRQQKFKEEKEKIMKNIILLSLEVQHMRQIHSQYEYKLKVSEQAYADLNEMYELKLQQIKIQLSDSFYRELAIEKERTMKDFLELKQIYSSKIALVSESTKNKQLQLDIKSQQAHDRALKIELFECKILQKQKIIEKFSNQITQIEHEKDQKNQTIKFLQQKIAKQEQQTNQIISNLKIRNGEAATLNEQMYNQLKQMRASSIESEEYLRKIQKDNYDLRLELQTVLKKMKKMQQELQQLNRKTYKNKQIPLNGHYQPRELTQRQREHYMTQNHIVTSTNFNLTNNKESQSLMETIGELQLKLNDKQNQIMALNQQIEQLQENIKNLESKITELSSNAHNTREMESVIMEKQNEIVAIRTENQANLKQIDLLNIQIQEKELVINQKQEKVERLKEELVQSNEEYGQKLLILTKRTSNLQISWRDQQKQIQSLHRNIQSKYLNEISALKTQVQNLQKTIVDTNLMFETMEIKRSEEIKSKSKSKKNK